MSIDTLGDFLTVIRNALAVRKRFIKVYSSRIKMNVASVLKEEGYIKDFIIEQDDTGKSLLTVHLKYVKGDSVIHEITRVSKPSRRVYERLNTLAPVIGGLGVSIISTNAGVITDKKARELQVGGEVICYVW